MYEDLLIGGQVDVLTAVNEGLLDEEQTDVNKAEKRPSCAEGKWKQEWMGGYLSVLIQVMA